MPRPLPHVKNLAARFTEMNDSTRLVGLQETYDLAAMALLLTSVIKVSCLHLELYGLNKWKGRNALTLFTHKKAERIDLFK